MVGRALRRVVEDVFQPLPVFLLKLGERELASGPPTLNLGLRFAPSLCIQAGVAGEIGCLGGKSEAAPGLFHDVTHAQQDVLLDGKKIILRSAAQVGEDFHVLREAAVAHEADAGRIGADHRMAQQQLAQPGEDASADWMRIGTVEEIGLRSTRIRGIDRTITVIPNADFANMHIVNLTERDERLLRTTLQLRYETTEEQMRYILAKLRELLLGHPMVTPDPARVRFVGYGSFSMNVEVFAYLRCKEQNDFLAVQEDILLRMGDIVSDAGTGFAYTSQRAYLGREAALDTERGDEVEAAFDAWREVGKLPFPEFEDEERERLEDILDYPPKGSPAHEPRVRLSEPNPGPQAPGPK